MIRNIRTSIRRIRQNLRISLISMIGFAISFLLLILIAQYVIPILGMGNMHQNKERIFTATTEYPSYGMRVPRVSAKIFKAVQNSPHIESITPFSPVFKGDISIDKETFIPVDAASVDTSFLSIFSFKLTNGNAKTCLKEPYTAIITEHKAKVLFGDSASIGRRIIIREGGKDQAYTITGLLEDYPSNTLFNTEVFLSYETKKALIKNKQKTNNILASSETPFILIRKGHTPQQVEALFKDLTLIQNKEEIREIAHLHSLKDFYLDKTINQYYFNNADINKVWIFISLGILILTISSANYFNFLISTTLQRAQVNATMKVFGNSFNHFFSSYFLDTLMISLSGLTIAFIGYSVFLYPFVKANFELFRHINNSTNAYLIAGLIAVLISLLAAFMGALWSNRHNITKAHIIKSKNHWLSNGMLVFQFTMVVFLLISGSILYKQLFYLENSDLGFNKENIITLTDFYEGGFTQADQEEFLKTPGVSNVGFTNWKPGRTPSKGRYEEKNTSTGEAVVFSSWGMSIDEQAFDMLGLELIAGRFYRESDWGNNAAKMVNEAYMKNAGLEYINTDRFNEDNSIIGVVKDFHFFSKHEKIEPLVIYLITNKQPSYQTLITLEPGFKNQKAVIRELDEQWKSDNHLYPLEWSYMDEHVNSLYQSEEEFTHVMIWLTIFSISITLLGLIGMVIFVSTRKTKEIGIRKANGAETKQILLLVNRQFIVLAIIGFIIACPLAWLYLTRWLTNFAYKTDLSWWIFLLAGIVTLILIILTVSLQTLKSAKRNPIEALRYE